MARTPNTSTPVSDKSSTQLLRDTLSMLGYLAAAIRTENGHYAYNAEKNLDGFIATLKHYKLTYPKAELGQVVHYIATRKWVPAFKALSTFSKAFGPALRRAVEMDATVNAEMLQLTENMLALIAADPSRWANLESTILKRLPRLGNTELLQLWRVKIVGTQEEHTDSLEDIVKQVTKSNRLYLTVPEKRKLMKDNPELNQQYNDALNKAMKHYRAVLRNYILDHDNEPQPVPETRKYIESQGIHIHDLYKQLDSLNIGADGYFYTTEGDRIINRPLPGAIIGKFNKAYDPNDSTRGNNWVFEYKVDDPEADWSKAYTEKRRREAKTEKSTKITPMLDSVPKARPKWIKDMLGDDEDISRYALMTDICYLACTRIGSESGYTRGFGKTYGLSSSLRKHVSLKKNSVTISYPGKDAKTQTHIFSDSDTDEHRIAEYIRYLCNDKKPDDHVFTHEDGDPVTDGQVRSYMKTLGIPNLTPHKMRSIRGTRLMRDLLSKYKKADLQKLPPKGPTSPEAVFKKEALEVGKMLGHFSGEEPTANTAIQSYIDPVWAQSWFVDNGLRTPLWIKITSDDKD